MLSRIKLATIATEPSQQSSDFVGKTTKRYTIRASFEMGKLVIKVKLWHLYSLTRLIACNQIVICWRHINVRLNQGRKLLCCLRIR